MTATAEQAAERPAGDVRQRRRRRSWPLAVLGLLCAAALVFVLPPYLPPDMRTSRIPPSSTAHYVLLVFHIFTAAIALAVGTVQFWPWMRRRLPAAHRWTGRAYLFLGVFPSAVVGVPVTVLAPFGLANQSALFVFDVLWLLTGVAAYRAARQGRYAEHRIWMIRNFALTFGAVSSRMWQPLVALIILPQANAAPYGGSSLVITHDIAGASAWLGFAVNLIVAEWYLQRRYGVRSAGRPARPEPRRVTAAPET